MDDTFIVEWNIEKNIQLIKQRRLSFEAVEQAILDDKVLDIVPHYNKNKYPHQELLILLINEYVHYVPFIQEKNKLFLKSIIPSRKYNKIYNK